MPWKKDEAGAFVVDDKGNPIFVQDGGEERSVDYSAMSKKLSEVNRESAGRKDRIRELEEQMKAWEGIENIPDFVSTAKKNAEAVAAFNDKERGAEEATQARIKAATTPLEAKVAELEADRARIVDQYHASTIRSQFGSSKFVTEELVSAAMAQELFAKHFSVDEQGQLVGKDSTGNVIYGENGPADFDMALREIVKNSPHKAYILKGSQANGSGATPGGGNNPTGQKTIRRSEFEKLDPATRAARMRDRYVVIDG